jgi:hypothetical protein
MAVASPACHRYTDGFAAEADLDALSSPMTPATTVARSILYAKSISAREWTRELGSRSLGRPHDPERRRRMAESYHRFRAMSADAQREYLFAKRARWLIACLVTQGDRRVFRLRCEADGGGMVDLETSIGLDEHPIELLLRLMRMPHAPTVLRLDCAKTTARYLHRRPKPVVTVEREQQLERRRERKRQYMRRRYRQRLSAVAAADAANPAVSNG